MAKNFFLKENFFSIPKIFFLSIIVLFGLFFLTPEFSNAGYLPDGWSNSVDTKLKLTHKEGDGVGQIKGYLSGTFVPLTKFLMISLSVMFLIVGLFSIITSVGSESETEAKNFGVKFGYSILGFIMLSFAERIAEAFNPLSGNNNNDFGDIGAFKGLIDIIVDFGSVLIGGVAVGVIVIAGISIVKSHGEGVEEEFKKIGSAFAGLLVVLLSRKFIYEIFFINNGVNGVNQTASLTTTQEIMGIVSYFVKFIAIGAVALIILAGIYYMTSSGEGNDNTALAKGIIKNVSIGLVILMSSYSLVTIFLPTVPVTPVI